MERIKHHPHKPPLTVVVAALVDNGRILLIRRRRGDYVGLWGLPGGKVERGEHLSEAAVREIAEESGIEAEFVRHLGVVSEHLVEGGRVVRHFVLHVCELRARSTGAGDRGEGELGWFDMGSIGGMKERIIPSDFAMIEKIVGGKGRGYYNCVLEKSGGEHRLVKFE